jgi:hypothetical protein
LEYHYFILNTSLRERKEDAGAKERKCLSVGTGRGKKRRQGRLSEEGSKNRREARLSEKKKRREDRED